MQLTPFSRQKSFYVEPSLRSSFFFSFSSNPPSPLNVFTVASVAALEIVRGSLDAKSSWQTRFRPFTPFAMLLVVSHFPESVAMYGNCCICFCFRDAILCGWRFCTINTNKHQAQAQKAALISRSQNESFANTKSATDEKSCGALHPGHR